jgi:formylglycine-generating enzyme required for sulfatase activity
MVRGGGIATTSLIFCASLLAAIPAGVAQDSEPAALRDCPTCPELVVIPPGTLAMGSPPGSREMDPVGRGRAERGVVEVSIARAFAIGRYEITRGEYAAFVAAAGYDPKIPFCRVWDNANQRFYDMPDRTWRDPGLKTAADDRHPVTCVGWPDAVAYATWLSSTTGKRYRLPSEAEWEYAARAGSNRSRFWGDDPSEGCSYANIYDLTSLRVYPLAWSHAGCVDGFADVAPVGSLIPNAWGLHDMIGNVWEWVADCFTTSKEGRPKDQRAWEWANCSERALRGGSWMTAPNRSRVAYPAGDPATDRYAFLGFRVARDLEAGEGR